MLKLSNKCVFIAWHLIKHSDNFTLPFLQHFIPEAYLTQKYNEHGSDCQRYGDTGV